MSDPAVVDEEQMSNRLGSNLHGVNEPLLSEQN